MDLEVKIKDITEAQAIVLEEFFAQMVNLGQLGGSRWVCFYSDGDGNFRPKIDVNGKKAQFAPDDLLTDEQRKEMWQKGEFRIDFDTIAWALRKKNEK